MNIDIESMGLLGLILQDSPKDRQLILCVLARSNAIPSKIVFNHNTDYPTFYGYSNSRIPLYLMGKKILTNVPRQGFIKRLISAYYLSYAETIINGAKNWDINEKLFSISKHITLDNKTAYKDAEVFLIYRDKALDYIKGYSALNPQEITSFLGIQPNNEIKTTTSTTHTTNSTQTNWSDDFKWEGNKFVFGKYGSVAFISADRKHIFKSLTEKRGGWANY